MLFKPVVGLVLRLNCFILHFVAIYEAQSCHSHMYVVVQSFFLPPNQYARTHTYLFFTV